MTRRNSKTEKTEMVGAIAFIVCTLLVVCACALIAVSGDVAAVLAVAVLGTIVALMARLMAMAIASELFR